MEALNKFFLDSSDSFSLLPNERDRFTHLFIEATYPQKLQLFDSWFHFKEMTPSQLSKAQILFGSTLGDTLDFDVEKLKKNSPFLANAKDPRGEAILAITPYAEDENHANFLINLLGKESVSTKDFMETSIESVYPMLEIAPLLRLKSNLFYSLLKHAEATNWTPEIEARYPTTRDLVVQSLKLREKGFPHDKLQDTEWSESLTNSSSELWSSLSQFPLNLTKLTINSPSCTSEDVIAFSLFISGLETLREVAFNYVQLNPENASLLGRAFGLIPELRTLQISSASLLELEEPDESMQNFLTEYLTEKRNIERLDLARNNMEKEAAAILAKGLQFLPMLKTLDLTRNLIGDAGAIALAENLNQVPRLETLSFSLNNIFPQGAIAIARALRHVPGLKVLALDGNPIENDLAFVLADAIPHLPNLRKVYLHQCLFEDDGKAAIQESIGDRNIELKL